MKGNYFFFCRSRFSLCSLKIRKCPTNIICKVNNTSSTPNSILRTWNTSYKTSNQHGGADHGAESREKHVFLLQGLNDTLSLYSVYTCLRCQRPGVGYKQYKKEKRLIIRLIFKILDNNSGLFCICFHKQITCS